MRNRPDLRCGGSGIRTHGGLPHTRFPSVPIRPLSHPSWGGTPDGSGYRVGCPWPQVAAGSCATAAREPSQGREAAALSGNCGVPQTAWPSPGVTGASRPRRVAALPDALGPSQGRLRHGSVVGGEGLAGQRTGRGGGTIGKAQGAPGRGRGDGMRRRSWRQSGSVHGGRRATGAPGGWRRHGLIVATGSIAADGLLPVALPALPVAAVRRGAWPGSCDQGLAQRGAGRAGRARVPVQRAAGDR